MNLEKYTADLEAARAERKKAHQRARRDRIATAVFAAMLSRELRSTPCEHYVPAAVSLADKLIAELDK